MSNSELINILDVPKIDKHGGEIKVFASPKTMGTTKLIMGTAILLPRTEIVEHVHDYGEEVIFVVQGAGKVFLDGKQTSITAGDAFIARQGVKHKIINDSSAKLHLIFSCAPLAPSPQQGHRNMAKEL